MKPIVCPCGYGYDGDKWLECPQASNHAAIYAAEKEEIRRGELVAEVLKLKQKGGRYETTWGSKTAIGLYRTVQALITEGK